MVPLIDDDDDTSMMIMVVSMMLVVRMASIMPISPTVRRRRNRTRNS